MELIHVYEPKSCIFLCGPVSDNRQLSLLSWTYRESALHSVVGCIALIRQEQAYGEMWGCEFVHLVFWLTRSPLRLALALMRTVLGLYQRRNGDVPKNRTTRNQNIFLDRPYNTCTLFPYTRATRARSGAESISPKNQIDKCKIRLTWPS